MLGDFFKHICFENDVVGLTPREFCRDQDTGLGMKKGRALDFVVVFHIELSVFLSQFRQLNQFFNNIQHESYVLTHVGSVNAVQPEIPACMTPANLRYFRSLKYGIVSFMLHGCVYEVKCICIS